MKYPWGNSRRINLASGFMKREYGTRLQKISIDAGFSCPNRDGTIAGGGCAFCNNDAFSPGYCRPETSIPDQLLKGMDFHRKRYRKAGKYLAYFQAYSNTHDRVEVMRDRYEQALSVPGISGLIIGTRPDCMSREKMELLATLAKKTFIVLEFGIESIYDSTLLYINRGHTFAQSVEALKMAAEFGLRTGGHFVFGIPGETRQQMIDSAEVISQLPLHSVKFHQLQIIKGTRFEKEYIENPDKFNLFGLEEYTEFIAGILTRLNPALVVDRIAGESQPGLNVGPSWNLRYDQVLKNVEQYMESNDLWQGKQFLMTSSPKPVQR